MYRVGVREHFMIAHSFRGELFVPAQRLHGATYVVDLELSRSEPDADGVVVDIGRPGEEETESVNIFLPVNFPEHRRGDGKASLNRTGKQHGTPVWTMLTGDWR